MGRGLWAWAIILAGGLILALFNGSVAARRRSVAGMQGCSQRRWRRFGNTEAFGLALFHGFSFPFEVTGVLLVIAVLGAVVLGQRAFGDARPVEHNGERS